MAERTEHSPAVAVLDAAGSSSLVAGGFIALGPPVQIVPILR